MESINARRREMDALSVGEKVWYLRPPDSGTKLESRWLGPCVITGREGEHSYLVEVKPGYSMKAHRSMLKRHVVDEYRGEPIPLFYHKRTTTDENAQPDMWLTERILGHKNDSKGQLLFRTKWQGSDQITWEPVGNFFHVYSADLIAYCKENGVSNDVSKHLPCEP